MWLRSVVGRGEVFLGTIGTIINRTVGLITGAADEFAQSAAFFVRPRLDLEDGEERPWPPLPPLRRGFRNVRMGTPPIVNQPVWVYLG